jgi:hypothetical protein
MKEIIKKAMENLSKNKDRVFHSEADFQFQLAWELKSLKDFNVRLEYSENLSSNKNGHFDIVIITEDQKYIPVELKYFTKPHHKYPQLKQQNDTWRTYDYFEDMLRVEHFVNQHNNSYKGYTIVLSNYAFFWEGNVRESTNYYDFRILNNREIKPREYKWADSNAKSVKGTRREKNIELKGHYKFEWNAFLEEEDLEFKYMINEYLDNKST